MSQKKKWGIVIGMAIALCIGIVLLFGGVIHFFDYTRSQLFMDRLENIITMPDYDITVTMQRLDTNQETKMEWLHKEEISFYFDDSKKEKIRKFIGDQIYYLYEDEKRQVDAKREDKSYSDYVKLFHQYRQMAEFLESHYIVEGFKILRVESFKTGNDAFAFYFYNNELVKIEGSRHGNPLRCSIQMQMPLSKENLERIEEYQHYGRGFAGQEIRHQLVTEVNEADKPAMVKATVTLDHPDDIRLYYTFENTYGYDWLSSEVVGMVGVPMALLYEEELKSEIYPKLTFYYDEAELECDEKDLRIMWLDEEAQFYITLDDYELNANENAISVEAKNPGTYVLEDSKIWEAVWNGTYDYAKEMKKTKALWTKEFDASDIEALADVSIYSEQKDEYHIETLEQLAGLVKIVNEGQDFSECDFYLENDLDLKGYKWLPIGWYYPADQGHLWQDFPFNGRFHGQNHIIYNMTIYEPSHSNLGMFGRTLSDFFVEDLGLVDCNIKAKFYSGCICGDNISNGGIGMKNCFVTGMIDGQIDIGALVGSSARMQIENCYAWMYGKKPCKELAGDLRGGELVQCYINDEVAKEKLSKYIHADLEDIG